MKLKYVRKRTFIILGVGLLVALLGIAMKQQATLIMLGLLMMFSSVIHHVIFYRCPHCGKHLGRDGGDYCRHCGTSFDEDPKS